MATATRELYWNIEGEHWLYLLFIIALVIFGYGVFKRVTLWKLGQPENRWKDVGHGVKDVISLRIIPQTDSERSLSRTNAPRNFHGICIFSLCNSNYYTTSGFRLANFPWLGFILFIKFTSNLFGLIALLAILVAAYRRYIQRPDRLDNKPDDAITLVLLFAILVTGFVIQGVRIAAITGSMGCLGFCGAVDGNPSKGHV